MLHSHRWDLEGLNAIAQRTNLTNPRRMEKGVILHWDASRMRGQNISSHTCASPPGGWPPSPSPDLKTPVLGPHFRTQWRQGLGWAAQACLPACVAAIISERLPHCISLLL